MGFGYNDDHGSSQKGPRSFLFVAKRPPLIFIRREKAVASVSWLVGSYFPLGSPSVALSGCHELIKRCASAAPLSSSRREFVGCLVFSSDGIVLVAALDSHHRSLFDLLVCCLCPCGFSCCQSATLKQAPRLENGFTLF